MIDATPVFVTQQGNTLRFSPNRPAMIRRYFALDHDLKAIQRSFPATPALHRAIQFGDGLRILRQPLWECLATFITSPMKQVSHIRQIHATLCARYGRPVRYGGETLHAYPEPEALAGAGVKALRQAGLGFRADKLAATSKAVACGDVSLQRLERMNQEQAADVLRSLPGVGPKVAHCILLFGLGHLGAFPIDVWVQRALRKEKRFSKTPTRQLPEAVREFYGPFAGYAQQYLFHYARCARHSTLPLPAPACKATDMVQG